MTVIGHRVVRLATVESTNTLAAGLADEPDAHGLAVLAAEQTAGRGQHGRTWSAPAGSSVLLSVVLHPAAGLRRPVLLTAWAAVSVCAVVESLTRGPVRIKWPNDVLLAGRKVCGILIEQGRATVAGIGLNVSQPAEFFAAAGLPAATSLSLHGATADADAVADLLLAELDANWSALEAGAAADLERRWRAYLDLLGREVRVETAGAKEVGRLVEIGFDGLVLEAEDGSPRGLACEAVRHVTEAV